MAIDLSKFKSNKYVYTEEEIQKAIEESERRAIPIGELHEVRLSKVDLENATTNERNPNWFQTRLEFANAAGETAKYFFMLPLADPTFISKSGAPVGTRMLANCTAFLSKLGMNTTMFQSIKDKVIATDGQILTKLEGMQCLLKREWRKGGVHLEYDQNESVHYLHNYKGERCDDTPFALDAQIEGREKYAEVQAYCDQQGWRLDLGADTTILANKEITNDWSWAKAKAMKKSTPVIEEEDEDESEEVDGEEDEEEFEEKAHVAVSKKLGAKKGPPTGKKPQGSKAGLLKSKAASKPVEDDDDLDEFNFEDDDEL